MPVKKRASLGRSTSAARRMAATRATESAERREGRREEDRARQATSRAAESAERRQSRQEENRARQATSRAAESAERRQSRQEENRARQAASRAAEDPIQRRTRSEDQRSRQAASRAAQWTFMEGEAFRYDPGGNYYSHPQLCIGQMSDVCQYCNALKWHAETRGMCCSGGKVKLPELQPPPEPLQSLMSGITPESKHFLDNIRKYNSCFQMTSFGTSEKVADSGFMPTFRVQGQVYHRVGSLLPPPNEEHKFLQIYFMGDDRKEVQQRCKNMPGVRQDIVEKLQRMVHEHHIYVALFKTALQRMPTDQYKVLIRADMKPAGEHARRFNEPIADQVAVVISGNDFEKRDIVLEK